jgi:hypothetical protein
VAGIGSPLVTGDDVNVFAEVVDNFSFTFITPLCANDDLDRHA